MLYLKKFVPKSVRFEVEMMQNNVPYGEFLRAVWRVSQTRLPIFSNPQFIVFFGEPDSKMRFRPDMNRRIRDLRADFIKIILVRLSLYSFTNPAMIVIRRFVQSHKVRFHRCRFS